jgi:hypothetical protein
VYERYLFFYRDKYSEVYLVFGAIQRRFNAIIIIYVRFNWTISQISSM